MTDDRTPPPVPQRRAEDLTFLGGKLALVRAVARLVNELGLATVLVLGAGLVLVAMLVGYVPTPWSGLERTFSAHADQAQAASTARAVAESKIVDVLVRMERTQRFRDCSEIKDAEWRRECLRP